MHFFKLTALAFSAVLLPAGVSGIARAQTALPPQSAAGTISCEDPVFARDSSHARVIAHFGGKNVEIRREATDHGDPPRVLSIIYPRNPEKRLEILWFDDKALERPAQIAISEGSQWVGPNGARGGMMLEEFERAFPGPFFLLAGPAQIGNSASVFVVQYQLKTFLPGDCILGAYFRPDKKLTRQQEDNISGVMIDSISPAFRAAGMRTKSIFFRFPEDSGSRP